MISKRRHPYLWGLVFLLLVVCSSCSSLPQRVAVSDPQDQKAAWDLVNHFIHSRPSISQRTDAILFTISGRAMSFLGYSRIDRRRETFSAAGITPLGIKIFEFSGDAQAVDIIHMQKEFSRMGNAGEAIAADIRRIYFDSYPGKDARIERYPGFFVFTDSRSGHFMEYTFSAADGMLIRKRRLENGREIWSLSFTAYYQDGGRFFPQHILLEHGKNRYRLEIVLKKLHADLP